MRSYLEDFLFPTERQEQKVASLSGGERNRLMLAKLFMQPSNLLILDEPTNDLDLVTLQVLEAALIDYPGCVLMVTHDRFFLDKIATALFVFEGDGVVHRHEGGFELYRRLRDRKEAAAADAAQGAETASAARPTDGGEAQTRAARSKRAAPDAPTRRKLTWKEQQELEGMETRILEAEAERDRLAARLADPTLYRGPEGAEVATAYDAARARVEQLYARWAELEEASG
jgi:ABC transport system ATP-binding/permease protein